MDKLRDRDSRGNEGAGGKGTYSSKTSRYVWIAVGVVIVLALVAILL